MLEYELELLCVSFLLSSKQDVLIGRILKSQNIAYLLLPEKYQCCFQFDVEIMFSYSFFLCLLYPLSIAVSPYQRFGASEVELLSHISNQSCSSFSLLFNGDRRLIPSAENG